MISANTRKRSQAISIDGRLDDRYFAITSEVPRNIVESRISAMPRNGRAARAGADGASGFSSGEKLRATRSSRTAAADGGVTEANSAKIKIIESGRATKER